MSNRDRIARMAEEAELARKEKAAKKDAGAPRSEGSSRRKSGGKAKAKPAPSRIKIVWAVCDQTGAQVKLFPYAQEQEALADVQQRTAATGKAHFLTRAEVPFE
jgi:hypothetical protein